MTEILDLEIRKKIYTLLAKNPGLHLSKIAEILAIDVQLADYHLHYMRDNELITESKEGGYKRFYVKGSVGSEEKKLLSLLQQDIPLQIVLYLIEKGFAKPQNIRSRLSISAALLTYYLRKLQHYGVITLCPTGGKKDFCVKDQQRIINLLIQYKPNALLDRFHSTWAEEIPLGNKIKK